MTTRRHHYVATRAEFHDDPGAVRLTDALRATLVEVAELVQARRTGQTIDMLARQFGVHRTTVMAHLRRIRLPHE